MPHSHETSAGIAPAPAEAPSRTRKFKRIGKKVGAAAIAATSLFFVSAKVSADSSSKAQKETHAEPTEQEYRTDPVGQFNIDPKIINGIMLGRYVAGVEAANKVKFMEAVQYANAVKKAQQQQQTQHHQTVHHSSGHNAAPVYSQGGPGGFFACIRHYESRGNYGAVNSSSGAAGAYQFMQGTWDSTAKSSGHPELIGVNPASASPATQDAMAQELYALRGEQPWTGDPCVG